MKNTLKKIGEPILGYSIVAIVLIGIISIIALCGGTIMKFFGFEYNSVGSIILFFIVVAIIGYPAETIAMALPRALLSLKKLTIKSAKIVFIIGDCIATMVTMAIVDYFMNSVSASDVAIIVIAMVMALASIKDFDEALVRDHKHSIEE